MPLHIPPTRGRMRQEGEGEEGKKKRKEKEYEVCLALVRGLEKIREDL